MFHNSLNSAVGDKIYEAAKSMIDKYPYSWDGGDNYGATTGAIQEVDPYCNDTSVVALKSDLPDVSGKLDKSGGTMTGDLLISGIASSVASSKKVYFGSSSTSGARAYVSANTNGTLALGSIKSDGTEKMVVWDATDKAFRPASSATDCALGTSSHKWNAIRGVTIYENGTSLASKYALKTELPDVSGFVTLSGNNTSTIFIFSK